MTTLRDHFHEMARNELITKGLGENRARSEEIAESDEWALQYIDIKWLPSIIESFDDDGSGYITVAEINRFTESRPKNWR